MSIQTTANLFNYIRSAVPYAELGAVMGVIPHSVLAIFISPQWLATSARTIQEGVSQMREGGAVPRIFGAVQVLYGSYCVPQILQTAYQNVCATGQWAANQASRFFQVIKRETPHKRSEAPVHQPPYV